MEVKVHKERLLHLSGVFLGRLPYSRLAVIEPYEIAWLSMDLGDLKDPRWMYLKAFLFLVAGTLAGAGLLLSAPSLTNLFLLLCVIVSFSRFYYFCFYVIERYIDPSFRFAGLSSVAAYLWRKRRS